VQIGIIGSAGAEEYTGETKPDKKIYRLAEKTGELVAKQGWILITGGKGGIMETASKGAKKIGGVTVGIVKGSSRDTCNKYIDVDIVANTSWGGEEAILIASCDGIIAIGGGAGTLQELAVAYRMQKPIVAIAGVKGSATEFAGKYLDERKLVKIRKARSPEEAVQLLLKLLK
jgi:hypothetical protein